MSSAPDGSGFVIVGRVRKAHGLRGELMVEPLTDAPDAVFAPGRRVFAGTVGGEITANRQELKIAEVRRQGAGWRLLFEEIPDRTAAERWRDRYVLVPAEEIAPLDDGEVYLHELIDMRVQLSSGDVIGPVTGTFELPQGLMLEVGRESGSVMIPYERTVTSVDRAARVIVIDPPEGLLD